MQHPQAQNRIELANRIARQVRYFTGRIFTRETREEHITFYPQAIFDRGKLLAALSCFAQFRANSDAVCVRFDEVNLELLEAAETMRFNRVMGIS